MGKFIIGTFAILAWTFYIMSGGSDFSPETRVAAADAPETDVTRAQNVGMNAVSRPVEMTAVDEVAPAQTVIAPAPEASPISVSLTTADATAGSSAEVIGIEPTFTSLSAPAPASVASPDLSALREVAGRAVNMREGPATSYAVIDTLSQGTQTEVIETDGAGWVRVRVVGTGQMGWMAERLLTAG